MGKYGKLNSFSHGVRFHPHNHSHQNGLHPFLVQESMINAVLAASTEAPENDLPEDLDGFGEDDEGDEEEADDDDFEEVDVLAEGPTQDWRYGKVWFEVLNPSHSPSPWPPHHWPSRQVAARWWAVTVSFRFSCHWTVGCGIPEGLVLEKYGKVTSKNYSKLFGV